MATLIINLPVDLAQKAESKGLLSEAAMVAFLRHALSGEVEETHDGGDDRGTQGFDPRFRGKASPGLVGSVRENGDITQPLDAPWEAE